MSKKDKIIFVTGVFLTAAIGSVFLSTWLHLSLKQDFTGADQLRINACLASLTSDKQHLLLFIILLLAIIGACAAIYMMERNKEDYASEVCVITSKIKTPVAVGQGQHGTAKWLDKKEYPKLFHAVDLNPGGNRAAELIQHGYDDLDDKKERSKAYQAANEHSIDGQDFPAENSPEA